jgi:hypothetical protein
MDPIVLFAVASAVVAVLLLLLTALLARRERRAPPHEIPAYYRSEHWRAVAEATKQAHDYRCAVCNKDWQARRAKGVKLQVHHYRYHAQGQSLDYRERPQDVTCLCTDHHPKGPYSKAQIRQDCLRYLLRKYAWKLLTLPFRLAWWLVRGLVLATRNPD